METLVNLSKALKANLAIWAVVSFASLVGCQAPIVNLSSNADSGQMQTFNTSATNSRAMSQRPYVIMISIDGYRHDYNQLFSAKNLTSLAKEGVSAESLRPVYPSKTFPNHYSLATGLYADKHGIISNEFYDPERDLLYGIRDRVAVEDASRYGGDPLWNTVQKQGLLTATFFWVGSEAPINGLRPNYWYRYNPTVPVGRRIDQALEWLQMPEDRRPHLIMLYLSEVDAASHRFGVKSEETRKAVTMIDEQIGRLREEIKKLDMPVNLIVVSDHGMDDLDREKMYAIDQTKEVENVLKHFRTVGFGPQILLYLKPGEDPKFIREAQKILKRKLKHVRVLRRDELKAPFNLSGSPKAGDLIIEGDQPWSIGTKETPPLFSKANHGWDPTRSKKMHGIFFAEGPAFKTGFRLPTIDVVDVYPLVLRLFGLKPIGEIDGKREATQPALFQESGK